MHCFLLDQQLRSNKNSRKPAPHTLCFSSFDASGELLRSGCIKRSMAVLMAVVSIGVVRMDVGYGFMAMRMRMGLGFGRVVMLVVLIM